MVRRMLKRSELSDVVHYVTNGPNSAPAVLARVTKAKRTALVGELRRYGEDAVATDVEALSDATIDSIHRHGMSIASTGIMIPLALCLAAIAEVEGVSRPLARKRRKSAT